MSRKVQQPVGQKRLTNIAVVRLKKGGKRFEIACYQNKVKDWRAGIEKDLDEVLQTTTIFLNVGKGVMAKDADLQAAFSTTDEEKICLLILAHGELQVSDKERKMELDNLFRDVASVLVDKTVNPVTQRPYTLTMLERALRDIHFNCDPKKSAKQQALEALPLLQEQFPIERARMRLRLQTPLEHRQELLDELDAKAATIEASDSDAATASFTVQVEPGVFRDLHTFMQTTARRQGRIEVLSFAVTGENAAAEDFTTSVAPLPARAAASSPATPPPAERAARAEPAHAAPQSGTTGRQVHVPPSSSAAAATSGSATSSGQVVYARGPISGLPEAYESRRERFAQLDTLQSGWQVELLARGDTVDAVFYSPAGTKVGSYALARRQALAASKAAAAGGSS